MRRVIFVEPIIIDNQKIDTFFRKNNPDSSFVNPHICLVFPFDSQDSKENIEKVLISSLSDINDFEILLSGFSISYEEKNNFLFLNVIDANKTLSTISNNLYKQLYHEASLKGTYIPHITIGKNPSIEEIDRMYEEVRASFCENKFKAIIDKVYCKILDKDSEGNIKLNDEIIITLRTNKY